MNTRPPPLAGVLVLGASLLALGGLLWLWTSQADPSNQPVSASIRILDKEGDLLFNASNVFLEPGQGDALGILLKASQIGNFTVDVTYGYFGHAFVWKIADVANQGRCGWVYDVDGQRAPVAADAYRLEEGDEVVWHWDCE